MANDFKSRALAGVGTTAQEIYACPSAKEACVIQLDVANVRAVPAIVNATVYVKKGGNDYNIIKNGPVPIGGSLQVIYGQKLVLEASDAVWVKSSDASSLDVYLSVLEDV